MHWYGDEYGNRMEQEVWDWSSRISDIVKLGIAGVIMTPKLLLGPYVNLIELVFSEFYIFCGYFSDNSSQSTWVCLSVGLPSYIGLSCHCFICLLMLALLCSLAVLIIVHVLMFSVLYQGRKIKIVYLFILFIWHISYRCACLLLPFLFSAIHHWLWACSIHGVMSFKLELTLTRGSIIVNCVGSLSQGIDMASQKWPYLP